MPDVKLDLSPLVRAIERLDEGWARYQRDISDTLTGYPANLCEKVL